MRRKNACMLFLTAFIWGTAFVAQSVGMDYLGPFGFNGIRSLIGGVALLPCIYILEKINKRTAGEEGSTKTLIAGGLCCGLALFAASSMQQIGIQYTTAGKAGFVTAFYIVLVPVLGMFLGKKTGWKVWLAVAMALAGLYFLCITESFSVGRGDIYVFIGSLLFAVHILIIDYFAPRTDGVKMSCIQFFVAGILSMFPMAAFETTTVEGALRSWGPLLYAGVLSCGVAYTLQIIGQKNMNPTVASLILSLESCISVLAGWVILGERLSVREGLGCVLMFAAIILAQLPEKMGKNRQPSTL
ncbi:DMT family transporter [Faecalicatena contorta]|uniref:DMT family transporter n=1 Tax=Faecalicatena fissicatena TaxID=290055 RepID=A0ABS2EBS0_9FIRM|nr:MULTISPECIES: DMT family transporter [Clostridia]MBM6686283.1 DMT family transporter [Faecalicatena contorta]MBM6711672.1 DMT family transporter [Faecalicatena contorta]MBM6739000.1 DMT family transporter [Faecalicatena fissicatena]